MRLERHLASGMLVGYKRLVAGEGLPWHEHPAATLCVVLAGGVEEEDARRSRWRSTGDLVFRPYPERHRNRLDGSGVEILTLEIGAAAMQTLERLGLPQTEPIFVTSQRASLLARRARAELHGDEPAAEIELMGLAYELLSTVARRREDSSSLPPRWLTRVHDRLRDELDRTPTLADLAERERVSPLRLSRAFRRHYGASIATFLRQARVERALELLADRERTLADVALSSGFYDQSHLTNVFRRHVGTTPAEFRRRLVPT